MSSAAPVSASMRTEAGRPAARALLVAARYGALLLLTLVFVAPLVWMVLTGFKTDFDSTRVPPHPLPNPFTTQAYQTLSSSGQFPVFRWVLNSLAAAAAQTVLVLVTASMAAYALARLEFPGRRLIFGAVVATLFVPPVVLLIPSYLIVDQLGWLNTLLAVIVPGAGGAFGVFFLRQFYIGMPRELEEAALVDGANRFQTFLFVILPLARAALATLAVLTFLANWNDFLWPLYVLFSPQSLTLQPGLSALQGAASVHYPVIMAGGVLTTVPVLILFVVAQRHVVEGISRSGLTGQ